MNPPLIQPLIQLSGLSKAYQDEGRSQAVFTDLNLSVPAGEMLALLGRSGSGKSTLLNIVSGVDRASGGQVMVKGVDLSALGEHQRTLFRRRHMGFVFQSFNLIPTLTVLENLLLPLDLNGIRGRAAVARAEAALAQVDVEAFAHRYPDRLSGGQQQRVAIARALVHGPDLLLADEPTGNLDADTGAVVVELLTRRCREEGLTVVLATHSLELAAGADRVLRMQGGCLVEGE